MPSLVLTLIGADRPGLVDSVAHVVRECDGNWLESRMAHLAGQFAGIVRIEIDAENVDRLAQSLEKMNREGLSVVTRKDPSAAVATPVPLVHLELVGNDRPGIVSEVSHVLAEHNVNVEEFQTEFSLAAITGSRLFHASAELRLPEGLPLDQLQSALEEIALDLMVEIKLADPREEAGPS